MEEGLRGGDNRNGTIFDLAILRLFGINTSQPLLFLTRVPRPDADHYGGFMLKVRVEEENVIILQNDLVVMSGEGILIPPDDIDDLYEDFQDGICSPSMFCFDCEQRKECGLWKEEKEFFKKILKE